MADKLQGFWTFDKATFQPNGYRAGTSFSVNFTCNDKNFNGISITVPSSIDNLYTTPQTIELYFSGENGLHLYDPETDTFYPENKTIFITSLYDEVSNAEKLLQVLQQRATHIPVGDIEIPLTTSGGVLLKTLNMHCKNDIKVIPETEEINITENGEYTPSKVGYSKVIVDVASSGGGDDLTQYFEEFHEIVDLPLATKIKAYCFYSDYTVKTVNIPKATIIGASAFTFCSNLTDIVLSSNLTSIGSSAFEQCSNLALSELPSGLTSIGNNAFTRCSNLALSELPSGLTVFKSNVFSYCSNLALSKLPSGLTSIGSSAFYQCSKLTLSELPSGLTSIDSDAFRYCSKLTLSELPSGLTSIGTNAFYGCKGLTTLTFKGTPSKIGSTAFNSCTNLTTINVPWAEGEVANAPWGATNATINYNYTGE